MPIRKKLADAGVFRPEELDQLTRVYVATSFADETAEDREHRASRIIANFQAGIVDETELIELSRRPLGR